MKTAAVSQTAAISIVVAAVLVGGAIILVGRSGGPSDADSRAANNVSVVDGTQVITIGAKGGYSPKVTAAKAGVPTIIKVGTRGTFDCSSALAIPSLGYRNNLPPSGETLIDVPPQKPGSVLQGLCAMGMYNFQIRFD